MVPIQNYNNLLGVSAPMDHIAPVSLLSRTEIRLQVVAYVMKQSLDDENRTGNRLLKC